MDSYNFHFERMSNLDLHPLSLPLSRLSPAKSTSSIDQITHHHGKGDSAYSSFSGGSSAPEYPSPLLSDDLQHHSLHYADLKYVKAIYHPNVLDSDAKSMDQLYRSVEAISNQYRYNDGCLSAAQYCNQNQETLLPPPPLPPPPPARLDSFIATRNLENCRAQHGPEGQLADRPPPRPQTNNPDAACLKPDLVYGRLASQPYHRDPVDPDHTDNNTEQQKSANILSRSPPRTSQPEHPKQQSGSSDGGHSEGQRKRAHLAHGSLIPEQQRSASPWHVAQNMVNSSIQHKGQFYFVTGVCKSSESRLKHGSLCVPEVGSESPVPAPVETHRLVERESSHSTMDNMFRNKQRHHSTHDTATTDNREFYTKGQDEEKQTRSRISYSPSHISNQGSRSFDALEQGHKVQSREIGRHHSPNHPIFYCGPEENCLPLSNFHNQVVPPPISMEQANHHKRDKQVKSGRRQPLGDVASEKINKETTPLLYHLTGANRAALNLHKPKKDIEVSVKGKDAGLNTAPVSCSDTTPQGETAKEERVEATSLPCNTLDDSFKKYYKEKLKDAQSKVLRETSFKRRDLQLSWPHRVRQRPELRPTVLHTVSSSQDSETSTDTLTSSPTHSEGTDKENIKETLKEVEKAKESVVVKDSEKENGRPANVAQPQVARIKGRRRLTPEQKKLCYSEPENLNQLGDTPSHHAACRSLGNESEGGLLVLSSEEGELGEQGLVAARRKMFETRGRALSASSLSKTSLKHLQHKALVAYMERKTGHKVAESQQLTPQAPPASQAPSQRHSTAGKPSDWDPRPQSGNKEGPKKKPHRPHSAGRILDSTSSSIRYSQFSSSSTQARGYSQQASWRMSPSPSQGKSASVESLLDQPESHEFFRNRSTSTPHAFQGHNYMNDPIPVNTMDTSSAQTQRPVDEEMVVMRRCQAMSVPEGQRVRVVAQRGKSMEELGVSQVSRSLVLNKSSEHLDQLRSRQRGPGPGQEKRIVSKFGEGQEKAQGQTKRKSLFKQESAPQLGSEEDRVEMTKSTRESSESVSPAWRTSSRVRTRSDGSPRSYDFGPLVKDEIETTVLSCDVLLPPSHKGQESSEREVKSTSTSPSIPIHPRGTGESKTGSSRVKTAPPLQHSVEREQSVDEPSESQEVSLSCGVTTDPTLWIIPPEPGSKDKGEDPALSDNLTEGETPTLAPAPAASEPLTTSSTTPVPDTDTCQSGEGEQPEEEKETEAVERVTPAGETESPEKTPTTEEPKWEELVEEVVTADQSLARVLYPLTNRKTALMLMEHLLSEDTLLMEEHYKKKQEQRDAADSSETVDDAEAPPTSPDDDQIQPEPLSKTDVTEKKRLLVACIEERLQALEEPCGALQVEMHENGVRGEAVEALVRERCTPVELERYGLFIGDLERVVSLLLCLSSRLARVQNALRTVDQHTDEEEKDSLDNRHRLLCKQWEDAKDLKDNLDRRERMVSNFLSRCLTAEQLQDYQHFVQTKASLLIRMKDLDERQRLGEEQLESLLNTLPPWGPPSGPYPTLSSPPAVHHLSGLTEP